MSRIDALLIGENSFTFHRLEEMAPHIEAALGETVALDRTTRKADLEALEEYDVVIDYLTDSALTVSQCESLRSFVADGNGYLGLHCAGDLTTTLDDGDMDVRDDPVPQLRELIGGHFVGHDELSSFEVDIVSDTHPVVADVSSFTVFDEPYRMSYDPDRVTVLARMHRPELDTAPPVVWTREMGASRVCYSSLGHTAEAFEHEAYRHLLRNSIRWVSDT